MDCPHSVVFFFEEDASIPAHSKPLMLEAVLFCPDPEMGEQSVAG